MARAGIEAGDVVVRAGDAEVGDVSELRRALTAAGGEGKLSLQVIRQGARRTVDLQWEPVRWRVQRPDARERRRETTPRPRS
jgi:S1-C subfamily serine protease